jgi:hypothetical protein
MGEDARQVEGAHVRRPTVITSTDPVAEREAAEAW